jgi:uncharacterized protein YdaU (DUF1376 family)
MSDAPIMPFYTDSYLADCHHLSTEAHGAFLLILLHTWRLGGKALPDDDKVMMRIVKAKSITRWRVIKAELQPFFDFSDHTWRQKKLERTWALVHQKIEANRENGKKRHHLKPSHNLLEPIERASANAHSSLLPSINHKPHPKPNPTNTPNEEEKIMIVAPMISRRALDALKPVLSDSKYFLRSSGYRISPSLLPQIESAMMENDGLLAPASMERIKQIITRLMLHFPVAYGQDKAEVTNDYVQMLREYPEDLLCAAYAHILGHHKYNSLPKLADIIGFMEPEISMRKTTQRKLIVLQQQAKEEQLA